jgi:hypothetical protein
MKMQGRPLSPFELRHVERDGGFVVALKDRDCRGVPHFFDRDDARLIQAARERTVPEMALAAAGGEHRGCCVIEREALTQNRDFKTEPARLTADPIAG